MDAANVQKQQGPFAELKPFKVTQTEGNGSARSKDSTLVDSARATSPHSQTVEAKHEPKTPSSIHSHEDAEPEPEYPTSWRLALIVIGLCLSIFCMALVSIPSTCTSGRANGIRTTPFWRLQSPKSQTNSSHSVTWVGTAVPTSLQRAASSWPLASCTLSTPPNGSI